MRFSTGGQAGEGQAVPGRSCDSIAHGLKYRRSVAPRESRIVGAAAARRHPFVLDPGPALRFAFARALEEQVRLVAEELGAYEWKEIVDTGLAWETALTRARELSVAEGLADPTKTSWTRDLFHCQLEGPVRHRKIARQG